MMKTYLNLIALTGFSLALAACGGGGGGGTVTSSTTTTIAGAVIDGYIEGATVCLDVNANGICDSSEPTAVTAANGSYSLTYAGDTKGLHVLSVIPPTAKDADDGGLTLQQAGKSGYTLMAPAPESSSTNTTVTPLSTLVSNEMKQTGSTDAVTVETQLKQTLGISDDLLNHDYKATGKASVAEVAAVIANAISAAQSVLTTSTTFQSALGTTDTTTIQAAAQQAAINLVVKSVVPSMLDKDTGKLNGTVNASTVIASTQSVANNSVTKLAKESIAPKAIPATIQAFVDGVVIGGISASGDYLDANGNRVDGNWTGYKNALTIDYIKGDLSTMTSIEKQMVLVDGVWYKKYHDGTTQFLTSQGWLKEDSNNSTPEAKGDCMSNKVTSEGPSQIICLMKYDYSKKPVSSLINDPCKDTNGETISGCDPTTIFPEGTTAYRVDMNYDQEVFKAWVSTTWNGYGDGLNPKQTTLEGWLNFSSENKVTHWRGNACNTALQIKSYDSSSKTGTMVFADMSKYDCSNAYQNVDKVDFTETKPFTVKEANGQKVMIYQLPMIFVTNNPNDNTNAFGMFAEVDGKIFDGEYWAKDNKPLKIGLDGSTKIGNKKLLDTYLKMIGAPEFPY